MNLYIGIDMRHRIPVIEREMIETIRVVVSPDVPAASLIKRSDTINGQVIIPVSVNPIRKN